ncbi:MAG: PAS domain S-box protein [Deltaproteobacteria bacterium]
METPSILIVEDESIVAEDLRRSVVNFGYQVSAVAADGEEAVRQYREKQPDLVMMDIMLGEGMDGIEAAELIRSIHDVPVIYLTAYADDKVLQRAKRTGPSGYLLKPVAKAELRATIETALQRHRIEKEVRNELEARVRERTAELEKANEELLLQIVERKQAEEGLRESEAKYRAIIENMEEGYYEVDLTGNMTFCNDALSKILGYERSELIGKNNREYMDESVARKVYELFNRVYTTGRTAYTPRLEFLRKHGPPGVGETSISLIRDSAGNPTGFRGIVRDVTERKQAEEALKESEKKYRELAELLPQFVYEVNEKGILTFVNRAGLEASGYSEKDGAKKMRAVTAFVPEDRERAARNVQRVMAGEDVGGVEYSLLTKEGSTIPVVTYASPIMQNNRIVGIRGVATDVSELKRAEQALRESEEKYRLLVENANEAIMVIQDATIKFVNQQAVESIGYSEEELKSKQIQELVHPDDREATFARHLARLRGEKLSDTWSFRIIDARGNIRWLEMSAVLIDWEGRPATLNFASEITGRKQMEDERLRLATAIEQAAETIVITDTDGTTLYVNPAFESTSGYTREEALGENPNLLKSGEHDQAFYEEMWSTLRSGRVWSGHFVNKRKDGSLYEEEATISPIKDESGAIVNYVAVKRDVTEQTILEKQLLEAQKMEAVGRLAGGIAHDFNNLLQVILGYSDFLLMDVDEKDPHFEDIEIIHQTTRRAADLVQRILTFSRRAETLSQPVDLNRSVTDAEKLLRRIIPKMIDIEILLDKELKKVNADPGQVEQILLNLAVNAKDAMPEGGTFMIETQNVNLNGPYCRTHVGVEPGRYVRLRISDTGHGMDKEQLDHIFEPFYTTKKAGEGTGLGLAIVFGIVKGHGGHITCHSEPGGGTTFDIHLPVTENAVTRNPEISGEMPASGTETLLLVDDEDRIRAWGTRVLRESGYKVLTATNGLQALQIYERHSNKIDLVVLDLIMPGISGKRCLEKLLEIEPNVRVLVASGHFPDESTWLASLAGAKGTIHKPYDAKSMLQAVRGILDQE